MIINTPNNHPCPNCGYCPHCGRSRQTFYPQPFITPTYPSWPYGPTWGGGNTGQAIGNTSGSAQ